MPAFDSQNNTNLGPDKQNSEWQEFSISHFQLARHILACFFTTLLFLSLIMSELSRYMQRHQVIQINHMSLIYLLLLIFITFIALSAILSVRKVRISAEKIEISCLFWQEKLLWSDLMSIKVPENLRFGWIRTRRCPYLLVKTEFKNYPDLEYLLAQHIDIKT